MGYQYGRYCRHQETDFVTAVTIKAHFNSNLTYRIQSLPPSAVPFLTIDSLDAESIQLLGTVLIVIFLFRFHNMLIIIVNTGKHRSKHTLRVVTFLQYSTNWITPRGTH